MKKILVPTDLSSIAAKALDVAVAIARHNNAKIILLNIKMYPTADIGAYYSLYGASGISIDDAWKKVVKEAKSEMKELSSKYEGVKMDILIEDSGKNFVEALLNHKADMIVMGSNGADGLKEFFSGSNSEVVVRLASCPVLVVKGNQRSFSPHKVVFAVDFTHESFLKIATTLLPINDAELHFLHVDTGLKIINYTECQEQMHQIASKLGLNNCLFNVRDSPTIEQGINDYVSAIGADLVVMYTHGRTGVSHFFRGSIAENVVNHSEVPVFTYVES